MPRQVDRAQRTKPPSGGRQRLLQGMLCLDRSNTSNGSPLTESPPQSIASRSARARHAGVQRTPSSQARERRRGSHAPRSHAPRSPGAARRQRSQRLCQHSIVDEALNPVGTGLASAYGAGKEGDYVGVVLDVAAAVPGVGGLARPCGVCWPGTRRGSWRPRDSRDGSKARSARGSLARLP